MANNRFKVKLRSQVTNIVVAFDVTPDISESRSVEYKTLKPVHMPGGIHVYGSTDSRNFSISNIKLVSRTREEAAKNLYRLNVLRSWAMPYFGRTGGRLTGAPPDVLALSAYAPGPTDTTSSSVLSNQQSDVQFNEGRNDQLSTLLPSKTRPTNLFNIPCVLQSINIPYPSDVDYIPTAELIVDGGETIIRAGTPMPTIMVIDIQLMETHSPSEYNRFDLKKYRQGLLDNF
jgi:hypothetical protein